MKQQAFLGVACGWVALLMPVPLTAAEPVPAAQFSALRELIRPKPEEERWLQIPWQTNLWEARRKAAAEGKPILLWEMDGHPLGCT